MKTLFLVIFSMLIFADVGYSQVITTFAGNGGTPPTLTEGMPATSADIAQGGRMTHDNWGNCYLFTKHRVSKINAATGTITTYAGNGSHGFMGDGGSATAARIYGAGWLEMDSANNLYISDPWFHRIRKVDFATGIITTIAGNGAATYAGDGSIATGASFKGPAGIAIDASGNIFVADSGRIRKIDAVTGIISHYAGVGSSGFSGDGGPAMSAQFGTGTIKIDAWGNLFICDGTNNRVRKISYSGIITTVAGNGSHLYVADAVPATSTGFQPYDIDIDDIGNLYIADYFNHRVRSVNAAGIIQTVAGTGSAGYSGDSGPAIAAQLNQPNSLAIGKCDGNLYINDFINKRVRKVAFTSLPPSCTCTPIALATIAPNDTVCAGDSVALFANIGSGGVSHTYQWYINGSPVSGATSNMYGYTPANGDSARCVITTSGGICSAPATTSSNTINIVAGAPPVAIGLAGLTVAETGDTVTVTATVTTTAGYYINWYRNGVLFATTSVPVTTFIKSGANDTITATAVTIPTEDMPCLDSAASALHVVSFPTGVRQWPVQHSVQYALYPNPVKNTLTISATAAIGTVTITNMVGQSFDRLTMTKGNRQAEIDVAKLPPGMYLVRVNDVWVQRFVKE